MPGDWQRRPPVRCLPSGRFAAAGWQHHFALRRPAAINLSLEDRIALRLRPRGTLQPATS